MVPYHKDGQKWAVGRLIFQSLWVWDIQNGEEDQPNLIGPNGELFNLLPNRIVPNGDGPLFPNRIVPRGDGPLFPNRIVPSGEPPTFCWSSFINMGTFRLLSKY
jgi:hypothetical protein